MNKKGLYILEYNKIIEMLSEHASTELGKSKLLKLQPMDKRFDIDLAQQNTEDALKRILKDGTVSFCAKSSDREAIFALEKGSTLSAAELLGLAGLLENTARVQAYGKSDEEYRDSLSDLFDVLTPLPAVSRQIRACIISEDEIADDASSNLRSIRRMKKSANDRIHTSLSKMVSDTYRAYLQDAVITMRNGRYCIPIKAEYKSQVPGMIHDQSSSASTYFVEPAAVVSLNNELRELDIEEEKEIRVILTSLSEMCSEHAAALKSNLSNITELDFIFAKGSFALSMNAARPLFNDDRRIVLKKARHPLLDPKKAVPITISLGDDYDLLIVTGPNTGGKTVSLKTVGLLTLMGMAGLHIPAADKSELSIFKNVYADIGDEQSIEQSLSTFSSHMKTIVYILKHADADSLCLFDELGAGTDPTEGAALAIAVLSTLHERSIRAMATTHYSELKLYALNTKGVENASCEFDIETLSPTYRLLVGIPGKSNAFAISKKLGLPNYIIEKAKDQISENDTSFEDVISRLEADRIRIEQDRLEIENHKREIEALKLTYEQRNKKLEEQKEKILSQAKEEARDILKEAKELADSSIREFNRSGNTNVKKMENMRSSLRKAIDNTRDDSGKTQIRPAAAGKNYTADDFTIGTSVHIISMNITGTVSSKPNSKGNLSVQCGIMNMQANIKDLEITEKPKDDAKDDFKFKFSSSGGGSVSKSNAISPEINLIGMKVDEAIPKLDKYLDDAYLSHLKTVRIVHGKGTGALRSAVNGHLKKISYIASYRSGEFGEGDAGVTIVEFK